jgi:hypothetical protein
MRTSLRLALALALVLGARMVAFAEDMEVGGNPDADFGRADMETGNTPEADMEDPADMESTNTPPAGFQNDDGDTDDSWHQELPGD